MIRVSSARFIRSEKVISGPFVVLSGGKIFICFERGDEVVFGNAIEKNLVRAEVDVSSRIRSLSASLGARDGRKPY